MSLASQVGLLATRIGNYLRDSIVPRLLPSGGTTGQVLTKVNATNYNTMWQTPFSGSYTDLTSKPTLFSGAYTDLTGKPTLFSGSYTDLTSKPTLFSGSYTDLTSKPTLGTAAAKNISVGTTAPSSPATGDIWIDTN
jgi:hypothetical protein